MFMACICVLSISIFNKNSFIQLDNQIHHLICFQIIGMMNVGELYLSKWEIILLILSTILNRIDIIL